VAANQNAVQCPLMVQDVTVLQALAVHTAKNVMQ
jgi:hypothetical protein